MNTGRAAALKLSGFGRIPRDRYDRVNDFALPGYEGNQGLLCL
jgi:hypothetical protein